MKFSITLKKFFRQSVISYKALFGYLDPILYMMVKIISPLFQLCFFGLLAKYTHSPDEITPIIVSNIILLSSFNAIFGVGLVIREERFLGTLNSVLLSPSNRFLVFYGRAFIHIIDALSTVIIGLIFGIFFLNVNISGFEMLIIITTSLVAIFSISGFGLLIGSLGIIISDINMLLNSINLILISLSGANFPISTLPLVLRKLSLFLPYTHSVSAIKLLFTSNTNGMITLVMTEFLLGCSYTIVAYKLFSKIEKIALTNATVDLY